MVKAMDPMNDNKGMGNTGSRHKFADRGDMIVFNNEF